MRSRLQQTTTVIGLFGLMSGCVLPVRQSMPATNFQCNIVNAETGAPVEGASVTLVYEGPNNHVLQIGPFQTDSGGLATISTSKKAFWMSGPVAFFTVGYTRHLVVRAIGFEPSFKMEYLDRGLLERSSPIRMPIKPFRNYFGGVIVKNYSQDGQWQRLILSIVDGPNAGETLSLRVMPGKLVNLSIGRKLYLKKSISLILSDNEKHRIIANNPDLILRDGLPNEIFITP